MNTSDNYEIVTNNEQISFEHYIKRLHEIYRDCRQEVYFSEIFLPLLTMCCPEGMKVVPIFDDRRVGPLADESAVQNRMHMICAPKGDNGEYVVPDYIFVPNTYSFDNPCKPYLMVETKLPNFPKYKRANEGEIYYCPLENTIEMHSSQLLCEINACQSVIYTDSITWMFLEEVNGKITEKKNTTIKLVNQEDKSLYRGHLVTEKNNIVTIDLSFIDPSLENFDTVTVPTEWEELQTQIKELLEQILNSKQDC